MLSFKTLGLSDGTLFCLVQCLLCFIELSTAQFLYPTRTLLPYNYGLPSNATVSATEADGKHCFKWKSSNPSLVHVFDSTVSLCSQKAVVSIAGSARERKVTRISAVEGGTELFCDVVTDDPKSIELSLIVDELFIGSPPQLVTVIARDSFGHVFSSLNGLQFNWSVQPEKSSTESTIVKLIPLNQESDGFAKRGRLGHSVLVVPLAKGSCKISASLVIPDRFELQTSEIEMKILSVRARPSTSLILLKYASVNISVEEGLLSKETDFKVDIEDPGTVEFIQIPRSIKALEYGKTRLNIVSDNGNFPDVNMDINVVKPAFIKFRISGGEFKILEEMKTYVISVDICDENGNFVFMPDNLRLKVKFPTQFYLHSTSTNGTHHVVQTTAPGKGVIKAELQGIVLSDGSLYKDNDLLAGSLEVTVCQKLEIFPPHLILPSESASAPLHKIRLLITGGTGHYHFSLNNPKATSLEIDDKKNETYLHIHKGGNFLVTVTDLRNINFIATAQVFVQPTTDIEAYPTVVEADIGNVIILPIALFGHKDKDKKISRKFDDCSKIKLRTEIVQKHVIAIDEEPHVPSFGKGCTSLQFRCNAPGYSRVNIFYDLHNTEGELNGTSLKTTTVLACFKTLEPIYPASVAVLPLEGSIEVAFQGGPRKWPLYKSGHYGTMKSSHPDFVVIEPVIDPIRYNRDLTVFRVRCIGLGENILTFRIGNKPSATNQHPAKSESIIKVLCSEPHSLHLKLFQKERKNQNLENNIVKVPFYGKKSFEIDAWLKDSMGRKIANISTLEIEFKVSDESFVEEFPSSEFSTYDNAVAGYRKVTRNFKAFEMTGITGNLKVTATLKGYRKFVKLAEMSHLKEISSSIDLKLLNLREIEARLQAKEAHQDEESSCEEDVCHT